MILKDYIKALNRIVKTNPRYKELQVVYGTDDEGNSYQKVWSTPVLAQFHDLSEVELEMVGVDGEPSVAEEDLNAIIIN